MKSAAITIIFNIDKTEVLLIKRRDIPIWVLPGGGIDPGESPERAAIREAYEETGYVVDVVRKTGEYTPINRLAAPTYVFECFIESGIPTISEETKDIAFFKIDDLPKPFFFIHHDFIKDALESKETVQKPLTKITYLNVLLYFFKNPKLVAYAILARLKRE